MRNSRYLVVRLVSTMTVGTTMGLSGGLAALQIPLERPVAEPIPENILAIEDLIKKALKACSEDKPITMSELSAGLENLDSGLLNTALLDLLWLKSIEEVDEGSFCLKRGGGP